MGYVKFHFKFHLLTYYYLLYEIVNGLGKYILCDLHKSQLCLASYKMLAGLKYNVLSQILHAYF